MATEYIERGEAIDALKKDVMGGLNYRRILNSIPAADVVSKAAYDQVAWERHLAEVQLKSIGKSIGEKMDDVQPVKYGRWIEEPNCFYRCSECGGHHPSIKGYMSYRYCPNCGADMRGE